MGWLGLIDVSHLHRRVATRARWGAATAALLCAAFVLSFAAPGAFTALAEGAPKRTAKLKLTPAPHGLNDSGRLRVRIKSAWGQRVAVEQRMGKRWRVLVRKRAGRNRRVGVRVRGRGHSGRGYRLRAHLRARGLVSRAVTVHKEAGQDDQVAVEEGSQSGSAGAAAPSEGGAVELRVGFNNNAVDEGDTTPDQAARLVASVGAEIDRVQVDWKRLETSPGEYRWLLYDAIYQADLARGVRPLFIFAFAPEWASGGVCEGRPTPCHAPPAPEYYDDAARTAAAIAKRYPKAAGIEIWNEPNTPYFWVPGADPAAYTKLLKATYRAVKAVDPSMPVAGGATSSGWHAREGFIPAAEFFAEIYEEGGAKAMDAISLHAYPGQRDAAVQTAVRTVEEVRAIRDWFGDASLPLWVTETGITTTGLDAVSEGDQATVIRRLHERLAATEGVEMVLFHALIERDRSLLDPERGYGLVRRDLTPKPAYCALADVAGGPGAC